MHNQQREQTLAWKVCRCLVTWCKVIFTRGRGMFLFLYGRLAKPWISGFGITTPKSGAPQSPPNLTPSLAATLGNKLIQQRKKCVRCQIFFLPAHKAEGKPWHMAGFTHYSLLVHPKKQCTPNKNSFFLKKKEKKRGLVEPLLILTNQRLNPTTQNRVCSIS